MVRILVTGFEPFGKHAENISSEVVLQLPSQILLEDPWFESRQSNQASLEVTLEKRILTVDEFGSREIASAIQDGSDWDAILHLGLCETCQIPRIETLAQDHLNMRIPDNNGRQISHQSIIGDGDFSVSIPTEAWMSLPWSVECERSQDAGAYLCNETFYQTLHTLDKVHDGIEKAPPCLFVHLPSPEKCSLERALVCVQEVLQRMMFRPVIPVVGALISHNEQYLVAQRSSTQKHAGKWEFPGGKVELDETQESALKREIEEEFGWFVRCDKAVGTWHHSLEKTEIALHILPTHFIGAHPNFEDKSLWTAHEEVFWRNLSDDSKLDWLGKNGAVVDWMKESNYLLRSK